MEEAEPQHKTQKKKSRLRRVIITLLTLVILMVITFTGFFLGLNYFGERLLRDYLQKKIHKSSNGLYQADFKTLQINILTGKAVLDSFELIPDTQQYRKLKSRGEVARALYRVFVSSLSIDKVHFRQILAGKRINFRQLIIDQPRFSIVGFPDTITARKSRWRVIYEDIYPSVSGFFRDFHIDSVKVSHGFFLTSFSAKSGETSSGAYEFSSVLRDVSVNPFSYYNRERVFYSRDVELVIHNFESQLADSLYSLRADEIGFSLTKSILYGKNASLAPNFKSGQIGQLHSGDLYRIILPSFSISGVNLYQAITSREVLISRVNLTDFFVQVFRNRPPVEGRTSKKPKKKITIAGLYTVIAKELRFIGIDSLYLQNGSFEFYSGLADSKPELQIGRVNLELNQFRIDSLAHLDRSRIFYARSLELELERISLLLRDGIHCLNASSIIFSTSRSLIDVKEATLFPYRKQDLLLPAQHRNTLFGTLPRLIFTGIDLKKVFNQRILDFETLNISEPEVMYTRYLAPKNTDPRFKKPEDFFEAENEDVVYDLLKKYLLVIKGNEISIAQGFIKYSSSEDGVVIPVATSSFDLSMQQFLIDSVHGMNEQGYFYSRDFDLDLSSVALISPDSLKHFWADRIHVATTDSLIEAENINVIKSARPLELNSLRNKRRSLAYEFSLRKLQLTGLNHKKLFLENILKANQIILTSPSVSLKTIDNMQLSGPPEHVQHPGGVKFIHTFDIGRCIVRGGSLAYDGEEDRKASYFSLKDIDFTLINAAVHVPEKGQHDGLIRFDSLQLKVIPLRAVMADSTYALEARSLEVNSYPANITLSGIKVTPLKTMDEASGRKTLAAITIPELKLTGFYFDRAIFENDWFLDRLYINHPSVRLEMIQSENSAAAKTHFDPARMIRFPGFMESVDIGDISIPGANIEAVIRQDSTTHSYSLRDVMLDVTHLRVDSVTRSKPDATPLLNAADIRLSAPGFPWTSRDSMYTFDIGRVCLSTSAATLFFDSVSIRPNFSRQEFSRKLGHQTDRMVVTIPRIAFSRVDFRKMISNRVFEASRVNLQGLNFEDYRDKRLPFPAQQRPMMPGEAVAKVKFPLSIDTVMLSDGFVLYEEQSGEEPGRIFFDQINATLTGLSTLTGSSSDLDLHGTFQMMGAAPGEAWFHFEPGNPRDTFSVRASIGEFDLTSINPMLSKLMPATIEQGTATATKVLVLNGNDKMASGRMTFRYHDLDIRLHPTKPGIWNQVKQSLLTEVANLLLADSNPKNRGQIKQGMIYFERDPSKGFFNFLWKSVLSGLKSTMGFNNDAQKEMAKNTRQAQRDNPEPEKNRKK